MQATPTEEGDLSEPARFELTLRCHNVRVEGMRGDQERNLLRQLASRQ
jgi:hypothetical protein